MFRHVDACGSQSIGSIVPVSASFKWILPPSAEEISRHLSNCNGLGLKSPQFTTSEGSKWQLGMCPSSNVDKNGRIYIGNGINVHLRRVNSQGDLSASVNLSLIKLRGGDDSKVLRTRRVSCFNFRSDSLACGFDDLVEPGDLLQGEMAVLCELWLEVEGAESLRTISSPCHCLELVENAARVVEAGGIAVAEYKRLLKERFFNTLFKIIR